MVYRVNSAVGAVTPPPIAEAAGWTAGRDFPADKPLLDVAQAVPSYPPATALAEHLAERALVSDTATYTDIQGLPALRRALAEHMSADYGGRIAADQVMITAGCNQAFCLAMTALAEKGDEVLLPVPYYFNHDMWLRMQGIKAVFLPFAAEAGGVPDVASAAARINERTRAIVLVTPNNPTGALYPPETIGAFYDLARRHDLALVVDETYKDFRPDAAAPHDLFSRDDWPQTFVQLYSFSKVFSLTGYRVGSIIGGPALMAEVGKIMDCVAICAPHIGQLAALYGLRELRDWCDGKRRLMQERGDRLREAFRRNDLGYELVSCGAYFAYMRHPFRGQPAAEVARRLVAEQNLLCLPGSMFGPDQEDYLRVAFANLDAEQVPALVQRLCDSQA